MWAIQKSLELTNSTQIFLKQNLRAVLSNFQLSSFGREKMKCLKLSQMNGLDNWFTKIYFSVQFDSYFSAGATILILPLWEGFQRPFSQWGQTAPKSVIKGKFTLFELFLTKLCTLPWVGVLIIWREKRCQNIILWRHIWWRHKLKRPNVSSKRA